jgi:hypothetical protein
MAFSHLTTDCYSSCTIKATDLCTLLNCIQKIDRIGIAHKNDKRMTGCDRLSICNGSFLETVIIAR